MQSCSNPDRSRAGALPSEMRVGPAGAGSGVEPSSNSGVTDGSRVNSRIAGPFPISPTVAHAHAPSMLVAERRHSVQQKKHFA
jgi:hypothetical protein